MGGGRVGAYKKFPLGGFLSYLVTSRHKSHVRLHYRQQFHSEKYLLEMTPSRAKMRSKKRPRNLTSKQQRLYEKEIHQIVVTNAIPRFRIVTYRYAASFLRKVILCEINNIFFIQTNCIWHKMNNIFRKYVKNKGEVTQDSFRNFVYASSYLRLNSFANEIA